jgi:hypothetical protein
LSKRAGQRVEHPAQVPRNVVFLTHKAPGAKVKF